MASVEPPLAGGTNVFGDQANTYITVSKESFAVQKPEAYVLVHYKDVDATQFAATLNEAWN
jgi:ABC-type Fe3+-hydroxamate transport system substrate-binding protein